MSQTKDIKSQVLKLEEKNLFLKKAKLAGIVRGCGFIGLSSKGMNLTVESENQELILKTQKLLKAVYQAECEQTTAKNNLHSEIDCVTVSNAKEILADLHVLTQSGEICYDLSHRDFLDAGFLAQFFCGLFLSCGSINLNAGYHLELVFSSEQIASSVQEKLAELEFMPKKVARRASFVIYLKEAEQISDFFALIGASNVVFWLQDIMVVREMRNLANRQANCITANIDKTVDAAKNQLQAIELIETTIGLESLDEKLRELIVLRRQYPEVSLAELAQLGNLSKSAINHRLRKIIHIAKELGGKAYGSERNDY